MSKETGAFFVFRRMEHGIKNGEKQTEGSKRI